MIAIYFVLLLGLLAGTLLGLQKGRAERSRLHAENFDLNLKVNLAREAFRTPIGAQGTTNYAPARVLQLVVPSDAPKDDGVKN